MLILNIFKRFILITIMIFSSSLSYAVDTQCDAKLTHGPILGAVSSNSATFVIRSDSDGSIKVRLSKTEDFNSSIYSENTYVTEATDYFGKVEVSCLEPNTLYFYLGIVDGRVWETKAPKSFRTFPEKGKDVDFSFLTGSCQQASDDPNSNIGGIFNGMAEEEALFFLHQGDWTYPDTTDETTGDFFPLNYSNVQDSYKARYDFSFATINLLNKMPVAYTYDDHDFVADNSDWTFPGVQNSIIGYQEMFPHYPLANPDEGIWQKFSCANADFFMLDNRSQRDPNLNAFVTIPADDYLDFDIVFFRPEWNHRILAGKPTIQGIDQMTWLLNELDQSIAIWKFISTGTPFNPGLRSALELALLLQKNPNYNPVITPEGPVTMLEAAQNFGDKWAGFPASSYRLLKHIIDNEIENVIVLSGDSHTSAIDNGENSVIPELMASGLDKTNSRLIAMLEQFGIYQFNQGGHVMGQRDFGNSFGRVSVFGSDSVRLQVVSEQQSVIAEHVVRNGFKPSPISASVAPNALDFQRVIVGEEATQAIVISNTSVEPILIADMTISDPEHFKIFLGWNRVVMPRTMQRYPVFYTPTVGGQRDEAILLVETNDPDGPVDIKLTGTGIVSKKLPMPIPRERRTFALHQNYPNPFNPTTEINFNIPDQSYVSLKVYNVLGQEVATIVSDNLNGGLHRYEWNAANMASGVYYCRLSAGSKVRVRKMFVLK